MPWEWKCPGLCHSLAEGLTSDWPQDSAACVCARVWDCDGGGWLHDYWDLTAVENSCISFWFHMVFGCDFGEERKQYMIIVTSEKQLRKPFQAVMVQSSVMTASELHFLKAHDGMGGNTWGGSWILSSVHSRHGWCHGLEKETATLQYSWPEGESHEQRKWQAIAHVVSKSWTTERGNSILGLWNLSYLVKNFREAEILTQL